MKWVNESGFLKFFVTPPFNRICHRKILKAVDRAVMVFELSAQRMLARADPRTADFAFFARGATWMTRTEFSKWSSSGLFASRLHLAKKKVSEILSGRPLRSRSFEVFSITRKLWVPNGRFSTSGRRKRRVKPTFVKSKIPGRSRPVICFHRSYWKLGKSI